MNSRKRKSCENQQVEENARDSLFPSASSNDANSHFSSIPKAVAALCLSDRGMDIRFIPIENADNPPKKFPAHKALLSLFSPVFSAMFHYDRNQQMGSDLKIADDGIQEVELEGVEPIGFEQFLIFVYTEKVDLTADNVASVLYTANRYASYELATLCEQFICGNLNVENVLEMLDLAVRCGYMRIQEAALKKLMTCQPIFTVAFEVASEDFLLGLDTLSMILGDHRVEKVFPDESELFQLIVNWAKKQIAARKAVSVKDENENKSEKNEPPQQTIRELLGPALFQFRFFRLSLADFISSVVPYDDVLSADEKFVIISRLNDPNHVLPEGFPFPLESARPRPQPPQISGDDKDKNSSSEWIKVKLIRQDTRELHFRLKKNSPMNKLKNAYAQRIGVDVYNLRYWFDGRLVLGKDTPASLEMNNDDEIEVYNRFQ